MAIGSWREVEQEQPKREGPPPKPPGYPVLAPVTVAQQEMMEKQATAIEVQCAAIGNILEDVPVTDSVAGQAESSREEGGQVGPKRGTVAYAKEHGRFW